MRDETIQFLFDKSPITVENQLEIVVGNYHEIMNIYRVLETQIIEDLNRREKAYKKLLQYHDELEEMKLNHLYRSFDSDEEKEKENKKYYDAKDKKETQIKKQEENMEDVRPVYYYTEKLNTEDLLVKVVLCHFWKIQKVARLDNKVRSWFGGQASKAANRFYKFVKWAAINSGYDSVESLEKFCEGLPKAAKEYFKAKVDLDEHRPVD